MLPTALVVLLLALPTGAGAGAQDSLAAARDLYTTAGYDDALAMLTRLRAATTTPGEIRAIDQYRAFALFAIGRAEEAERVVEGMTLLDPQWTLPDGEAAPRIAALFSQARDRALPGVLRQRVNAARALFAEKHYDAAAEAFTSVVLLLDDPAVARVMGPDAAAIALLATGFRDLALAADEQARAASAKDKPAEPSPVASRTEPATAPDTTAAAAQPALTSAPAPGAGQPPPEGSTASASETAPTGTPLSAIVPPVAIAQNIPRPSEASVPLGGPQTILLDIVIDETGRVERAEVRKSVDRLYETQLIAATRGWRYTPATQGGRPVKYLRSLEVTLNPR